MQITTVPPSFTRAQARRVFLAEDGVTAVRQLDVTFGGESSDDGLIFTWSARVKIDGDWFDASFHEHCPEFVDISW